MCIGFHEKYLLFLSYLNEIYYSWPILENNINNKFHENPSLGSRVNLCERETDVLMGGQTDIPTVIVAIRIFANTPKTLSSSKRDDVFFVLHFLILFF